MMKRLQVFKVKSSLAPFIAKIVGGELNVVDGGDVGIEEILEKDLFVWDGEMVYVGSGFSLKNLKKPPVNTECLRFIRTIIESLIEEKEKKETEVVFYTPLKEQSEKLKSKKNSDYFDYQFYTQAEICLDLNIPVLLVGRPGTGKSEFAQRYAQSRKLPFHSVSMSQQIDNIVLLGHWELNGKETKWVDGVVVNALKTGGVLLIDEWDCQSPENAMILQELLQKRSIVVTETGRKYENKELKIIATANTNGSGSEGKWNYAGTFRQNLAHRDRFYLIPIVIPAEKFWEICVKKFPEISREEKTKDIIMRVYSEFHISFRIIEHCYSIWKGMGGKIPLDELVLKQLILKNDNPEPLIELAERLGVNIGGVK